MNPGISEPAYGPVTARERIAALDVLRGIALLGIALMNVEFFTRPMQGMQLGFDTSLQGVDYAAGWAIAVFVQGKFWTLFSLLFGAGFALMLTRADARRTDPDFNRLYARRLGALLLFGLLHSLLLWPGDILGPYALSGFLMLLAFRNARAPELLRLGLILYFVPLGLLWLGTGVVAMASVMPPEAASELTRELTAAGNELRAQFASAELAYREGSWLEATRQRALDTAAAYSMVWAMVPGILGMFLLGAALLRSGRLVQPELHIAWFRRLAVWCTPPGLVAAIVGFRLTEGADLVLPTPAAALGVTLTHAGSLLLCLGYLALIVLAALRSPALRAWLAPVGRMALTNYLLQSVVLGTLFYGYGGGLWGDVPRAQQALLVFALFALQVVASRAWLARFRYGPMEWLWRTLTYGRRPDADREGARVGA